MYWVGWICISKNLSKYTAKAKWQVVEGIDIRTSVIKNYVSGSQQSRLRNLINESLKNVKDYNSEEKQGKSKIVLLNGGAI